MKAKVSGRRRWSLSWTYLVLWIGLISFFSSQTFGFAITYDFATRLFPASSVVAESTAFLTLMTLLRKVAHLLEYAVLSYLAWIVSSRSLPRSVGPVGRVTLVLAICLLTALADEFHQTYVPGRIGQWSDVGVDLLGSSVFLAWMIARNQRSGASERS